MRLDPSFLGWVHTLACLVALVLGAMNLVRRKGDGSHRRVGHWYLLSIVLVCVTSLGIYRLHRFFFPHWLAIVTIALAAVAYGFAHFRKPRPIWLRCHIISVVLTYYLLIAGGVNEVFLRVDVVRRLTGGFGSQANGMAHNILVGLTLILLVWFSVRYRSRQTARPSGPVTGTPQL
jgi:uncharacterized membrane protein